MAVTTHSMVLQLIFVVCLLCCLLSDEPAASKKSSRDRDRDRDRDRGRGRDRDGDGDGFVRADLDKKSYDPTIKLEYRDDSGAYRQMSIAKRRLSQTKPNLGNISDSEVLVLTHRIIRSFFFSSDVSAADDCMLVVAHAHVVCGVRPCYDGQKRNLQIYFPQIPREGIRPWQNRKEVRVNHIIANVHKCVLVCVCLYVYVDLCTWL